jgi:tRNA (guanine26-N2/guanine27-N2)-dimethyltransferase
MQSITEHSATITATLPKGDIHAKMEVFYNPVMVSNRNISILLLNSISNKSMNIALPLVGSGIRGIRFLNELKKGKMNHLFVNDIKENFPAYFSTTLSKNNLNQKKVSIFSQDANIFLMNQIEQKEKPPKYCGFFDYIDIDPFGSPNPFLASAIARISRKGIVAVTATDTAALTGTYPKVTKRKYWARSLKNYMMHEIGLRILIRRVQLQGVQFDKALVPILSYHKGHYFRAFFQYEKGKVKCDELLAQHQYFLYCSKCLHFEVSKYNNKECSCKNKLDYAGPLWTGELFDKKLITKMAKTNSFPEEQKFLDVLKEESKIDVPGFYDMHRIAKKAKTDPTKIQEFLQKYKGVRTHFSPTGFKSIKEIKL